MKYRYYHNISIAILHKETLRKLQISLHKKWSFLFSKCDQILVAIIDFLMKNFIFCAVFEKKNITPALFLLKLYF